MYCILQPGAESKFDAYFNQQFLGFGSKNQGGLSNSQGKNRRAGLLCLLELFDSPLNLAKFHSSGKDGMYHPCLVLWQTRS